MAGATVYLQPDEDGPPRHDIPAGGRSGFVRIDGRQIHYLEWGHAARPAVICLHGGGQTAYMYEDLGLALAGRYHVLAWDFPDHGDSGPIDDDGPTLDRHALAATVTGMCAEFGIDRTCVVGGSMGGVTGITVAARHPDLVAGLVLVDVGHRLEPEGVERIIRFMSEPESFASLEEAAAAIRAYLPDREVTTGRLTRNLRQRADGRWVWKHRLGHRIRQAGGTAARADERAGDALEGLREDLGRVRCPTLVLRGARSDVLSEDGAEELMAILPDARFAAIAGAGHLAAGDNPRSFVELVSGFVDELHHQ